MAISLTPWNTDPRVAPLLDAIRRNPPRLVQAIGPIMDYTIGRNCPTEYTRWSSDLVDALEDVWNEHFVALDKIQITKGTKAYYEAADAFFRQADPQALITAALDERLAA